ncbi:MAG: nucleoside-diphosphate sugar epimerase/dehydratase [Geothrix sp.]|nr:nucleoside-diphosphate sugar epimerase/dehydratase [Geothrix sp.]
MNPLPSYRPALPPPTTLDQPWLRQGVKLLLDAGLAAAAWVACQFIFRGTHATSLGALRWTLLALGVNLVFQLTFQHYRLIGFRDAIRIALATITLLLLSALLNLAIHAIQLLPDLGLAAASALTTGGLWLALRAILRARHEQILGLSLFSTQDPPEGITFHRTLIVGAGRAGLMIAQELRRHPELGIRIVGFIDDALDKQGIRLQGIRVLGPSRLLRDLIKDYAVTQVVLAIPSAPGSVIRQLADVARSAEVEVKTVPGLFNLLGTRAWKPELKDISIEDLLRRDPVHLDQTSLSLILQDSVVLITGGGGSIGGELARQVAAFRPARIVLLGRGENSLWTVERSLRSEFPNQGLSLELCDIRNTSRLQQVFDRWRPQVVLHAAAHKHVPYLEAHPEEAVENNIVGTLNVLRAARSVGTHSFVNISTDKAVNPTNVLGATKRIAEYLVLQTALQAPEGSRYVSVRFGNVLGSRGSVIPIFQEQIRSGGPLTVTHPEMTRYFMTIPEASQLVLQAGILGDTAKVYVLDMGAPVRIVDLATDMARLSGLVPGRDIDLEFTGIRPGEKLFEELFSMHEDRCSEVHPKVFNADPEAMDEDLIQEGVAALRLAALEKEGIRQAQILHWLQRLVPSYAPSPTGLGRHGGEAKDRRVSGAHPVLVSPAHQA